MVEYLGADDGAHAQRRVRHEQCDETGDDLGATRAGGHQRRARDVVGNLEHVAYDRERRHEALLAHDGEAPEDDAYCDDYQRAQQSIIHLVSTANVTRRKVESAARRRNVYCECNFYQSNWYAEPELRCVASHWLRVCLSRDGLPKPHQNPTVLSF